MPKINLTDEDKIKLLEAVNAGVEPSPDFITKLFPGTAEKFDVKALDRAKIPTLEYAGKRSKAVILAEAGAGIGAAPLQVVRSFGEAKEDEWQNMIVQGDNLQFLKTCYRDEDPLINGKVIGKVKLIYIDPPFGTGDEYGGRNGQDSYSAKMAGTEFIEAIRERSVLLRELLTEDGIFFIRIDHHFGHYIKTSLDELFGKNFFQGEIVINRIKKNVTKQGRQSLPTANDSLFVYFKSDKSNFISVYKELEEEKDGYWRAMDSAGVRSNPQRIVEGELFTPPAGRHFTFNQKKVEELYKMNRVRINKKSNKLEYFVEPKSEVSLDTNWTDISGYTFTTGYPTENSESLLERIILMTTDKNSIVMDVFGGSGSTAAVAEKLGRRWITCDFGKHSIYTMQKRMLRISESKALIDQINEKGDVLVKKGNPYAKDPKPFSVVSAGAYDFSHVMALGTPEHKDSYIAFVLGLFQLVRDEEKAGKTKLTNIYADKDGAPVEVFPVWDEHHFKNVKIDEDYLQSIITQGAGRLRGEYHIIVPEHCTNIGDTRLKNSEGKDVTFKFLTFPYKVLEDVSRHLELHEQPASQGAVNELITSTAFYFNEDVEIEVVRDKAGLKIAKFETNILNKEGNRFSGLDGLAMLLVDVDHEPDKPFDMDKTVFAKDIDAEGVFALDELANKKIAVIAIDKHGNESKPFVVTK